MYYLTLTADERKAIDWIGNRYRHGDEFFRLLWANGKPFPNDADWDDPRSITFTIPENIAWQISEIGEEDNWTCFAPALSAKLNEFCMQIV